MKSLKNCLAAASLILSGACLGLLFSTGKPKILILCALAGAGLGFLLWLSQKLRSGRLSTWLAAAAAVALSAAGFLMFRRTWSLPLWKSLLPAVFSLPAGFMAGRLVFSRIALAWKVLDRARFGRELIGRENAASRFVTMGRLLVNLLLCIGIGLLLIWGVYCLPVDVIDRNVAASAPVFAQEGTSPELFSFCQSKLDNYTDALMLLTAADNTTKGTPLTRAMLNRYGSTRLRPAESLVNHYLNGAEITGHVKYYRYWSGYLVFLKPLLLIMNYQGIRILNSLCQVLVTLLVCLTFRKKKLNAAILPWVLCYLMLMPVALGCCLQYSAIFYLMSLGAIAVALCRDRLAKGHTVDFLFFNLGIGVAYFDLLSYPLAAWGAPAAILVLCLKRETAEKKLALLIRSGLFFLLGYGGMWFSKWVLAELITGEQVISNALSQVLMRTSSASEDGTQQFSKLSAIFKNYGIFLETPVTLLCGLYLVLTLLPVFRHGGLSEEETMLRLLPYLLIMMAPAVWHLLATNHSSIHTYFTCKTTVAALLALLLFSAGHREAKENLP